MTVRIGNISFSVLSLVRMTRASVLLPCGDEGSIGTYTSYSRSAVMLHLGVSTATPTTVVQDVALPRRRHAPIGFADGQNPRAKASLMTATRACVLYSD